MAINLGTTEIDGTLYLGDDIVKEVYQGETLVFSGMVDVTLIAPANYTLSQTEFSGLPGATSETFTLTRTVGNTERLEGNATVTSSPALSFSTTTSNTSGLGNTTTITCTFEIPTAPGDYTLSVAQTVGSYPNGAITVTPDCLPITNVGQVGPGSGFTGKAGKFNYSPEGGATASYSCSCTGCTSCSVSSSQVSNSFVQSTDPIYSLSASNSVGWTLSVSVTVSKSGFLSGSSSCTTTQRLA